MKILPQVALVGLLVTAAAPIGAQSLTFGDLMGTVTDARLRPIVGAEVRAVDRSSGAIRWVMTPRDGAFRFAVLPAGRYDITVEALGYRPVVHVGVTVTATFSAAISVQLREANPPVTTVDTVVATASASAAGSWLVERGYVDLLGDRRVASEAYATSTVADQMSVEGLPWRLTESMIDGSRSVGVGSQRATGADVAGLALPSRMASALAVGGLGFDVEVGGTGVGIRATTQRAGRFPATRLLLEGGTGGLGGAFTAGGPLEGDTAVAIVGVDFQRAEVSRPSQFGENSAFATALVSAAQGTYATDLAGYAVEQSRMEQRWGGATRLDWQPSDRFAISMRASGSRFTSSGLAEPSGPLAEHGDDYEALNTQASLSIFSLISRRVTQELRVSADIGTASAGVGALPTTTFAGSGFAIGGAGSQAFEDARATPRVAAMLHLDFGAHRVKTGFALASHRFDSRFVADAAGSFRFGDVADFAAGSGAWRRVEGATAAGEFRMTETAFFLQDAWRITEGLSATLGARIEGARAPFGDIEANTAWRDATALDNRAVRRLRTQVSPRLGVRWELGSTREWVLEGGAGIFQDLPDHRDVAEALTFDRGASVRYGAGTITSWPGAPDTSGAAAVGQTLSLLGPEFEGPRTQRLALGITRRLGEWSLSLAGTYRYTSSIARRRDLNLPASPTSLDQYGRPLYGTLTQLGTLLAAVPQTNRRFAEFDAVYELASTGFSDYRAATLGLERVRSEGLSLGIGYTFSQTKDNVSGFATTRISPFATGLAGVDWTEARSDFDVPHRLLVAGEWSAGTTGAVRLGAIYRLASGRNFTPGVRGGVDANADGDGHNDPAFVDPALPGMDILLAEHDCLRESANLFVRRNSCRGELSHRVDVRVTLRIATLSASRLEFVLEALDVVATRSGRVDDALLLVDRAGSLVLNPGTGITTVPYVVNPGFGQVLADRSPGPLWRVGLRISP